MLFAQNNDPGFARIVTFYNKPEYSEIYVPNMKFGEIPGHANKKLKELQCELQQRTILVDFGKYFLKDML